MLACLTRRGRPFKSTSACPIPSGGAASAADPDPGPDAGPGPVIVWADPAGCGSLSCDSSHGGRDALAPGAEAAGVNVAGEPSGVGTDGAAGIVGAVGPVQAGKAGGASAKGCGRSGKELG